MCNSVCVNFIRLPWIVQMVAPFIVLVVMGMAFGPTVESTICLLCD